MHRSRSSAGSLFSRLRDREQRGSRQYRLGATDGRKIHVPKARRKLSRSAPKSETEYRDLREMPALPAVSPALTAALAFAASSRRRRAAIGVKYAVAPARNCEAPKSRASTSGIWLIRIVLSYVIAGETWCRRREIKRPGVRASGNVKYSYKPRPSSACRSPKLGAVSFSRLLLCEISATINIAIARCRGAFPTMSSTKEYPRPAHTAASAVTPRLWRHRASWRHSSFAVL